MGVIFPLSFPHISFCKGRTLYSVVRDTKNTLDINKTRQIAQEIVKVFCCLLSPRKTVTNAFKGPKPISCHFNLVHHSVNHHKVWAPVAFEGKWTFIL